MTTRATNPWLVHVKRFRSEHPELKYKEVLQQAKSSYEKKPKVERPKVVHPWMAHLASIKQEQPDWKKRMTYKELLQLAKKSYKPVAPAMPDGPVPMSR